MPSDAPLAGRLAALDAFRGLTIAFMLLVNTPGTGSAVYPPLRHASWHGWTITDVVFPSFVWIVGVAITLVLARRLNAGVPRTKLFLDACRRAAILFAFGLFIYAYPFFDLETARVLGVLQRIAICYLAAVAIYLTSTVRGQIAWAVGLLVCYAALMFYAPVPGYGAGHLDIDRNFAHYIDRTFLGPHNYAFTKTWDPEGIVSTLPAIASCIFGLLAGRLIAQAKPLAERTTWLFLFGCVLLLAALTWDPWLPINKNLWTSSFTLLMAGIDCCALAALLWIIDGQGIVRPFTPFLIFGRNAIAIYMAAELIDITLQAAPAGGRSARAWLYETFFAPLASPLNASLLYAIAFVLLNFAIAVFLHRRRLYLKV